MYQRITTLRIHIGLIALFICFVCTSASEAFTPQLTVKSSKAKIEKKLASEAKASLEAAQARKLAADKEAADKAALRKANSQTPAVLLGKTASGKTGVAADATKAMPSTMVNKKEEQPAKVATKATAKEEAAAESTGEAQSEAQSEAKGITFSNPIENKWRVGVVAKAGGHVSNAVFTFPVPKNWPEQTVAVVEEELPPSGIIDTRRKQDQGLEQFVVRFQQLQPNQKVVITKTFIVTTSQIDKPADTTVFIRPKSRLTDARKYMKPSSNINFSNAKIKKKVKELAAGKDNVWNEVEAIYDWVRDNVEDVTAEPSQIASVFLQQKGCNEDKVSLFVGMCRANKVPARMVWVQGTIYAEFMLVDASGKIHWFPCNVGGVREFGSYAEPRIILQKGDNFRVPEEDKNLKYVSEVFQGSVSAGSPRPIYKFFNELLPVN